jgi:hypothetical protein
MMSQINLNQRVVGPNPSASPVFPMVWRDHPVRSGSQNNTAVTPDGAEHFLLLFNQFRLII